MPDYTIGKGKLLFKPDGAGGFRDLGNCPNFAISVATEKKEHFSSRSGLQLKDSEVVVRQTATASFTLDEPNIENLKDFVMSNAITDISQTSGSVTDQSVTGYHDLWIDLGKKSISNVVVTDSSGTTTYIEGTDYEVDTEEGLLKVLSSGSITDGEALLVDYSYAAVTIKRADAATATTLKGDLYFAGNPPVGRKLDVRGYVSLLPEGDLSLIGEDWIEINFTAEFLESSSYNGLFEVRDKGSV